MKKSAINFIKNFFIIIIILFILSGVLMIWFSLLDSLRIVFGAFSVLALPGFFLSYIFFPNAAPYTEQPDVKNSKSLDYIERGILSLFFSISMVTLALTFLRRIEIILSPFIITMVVLVINVVCLVGALLVHWRWRLNKSK